MLDGIRANSQSLIVKLAFGIIIVVFVFWGIGSYTGPKGIVASVNGLNITEMEFQRAYAQMEENVRRSIPNLTPEMLESLQLRQRVLQSLVREKLIESETTRTGLTVSPYELRMYLMQIPDFQKDGKFDPSLYKEVLAVNRLTPQDFEASQAKAMLPRKLQSLVVSGAHVRPEAVKAMYEYVGETRRIDYMLFPAEPHLAAAVPSEEEVQTAYESRREQLVVPAAVDVEYVRMDPSLLGDASLISDEEVRAAYEDRLARYTDPEKIHARHLLIRVAPNASAAEMQRAEEQIADLEARIRAGEDFAEVAKAHGQDGSAAQGGDLGWFTAEQMVPEFSEAAFALKDGELSAPVRTQFGFHLIKCEEHVPAQVHPLEEVQEELRVVLATEVAAQGLQDKAEAVLAQALAGQSLEEAAKVAGAANLKVEKTGMLTAEELGEKLALRESELLSVMAAATGTVLDTPIASGPALLVVKVDESKPEAIKPLEEVRPVLAEELARQKAIAMALEDARAARAAFVDNRPAEGSTIVTSEAFGRGGHIAGLGGDVALAEAAFAAPGVEDAWLPEAFRVEEGAILARVAAIDPPGEEEWKGMEDAMVANIRAERANMMFQNYIDALGSKASIKTYNSPMLRELEKNS